MKDHERSWDEVTSERCIKNQNPTILCMKKTKISLKIIFISPGFCRWWRSLEESRRGGHLNGGRVKRKRSKNVIIMSVVDELKGKEEGDASIHQTKCPINSADLDRLICYEPAKCAHCRPAVCWTASLLIPIRALKHISDENMHGQCCESPLSKCEILILFKRSST